MNILIVGAGEVSFHLAKRLSAEKHNITVLERDPEKAQHAEELLDAMVLVGSGSSLEDLKNANIEQADVFIALSNLDEVNLLGCRYAQKLDVPYKIARVRNPEYTKPDFILSHEEMGVDLIIHPERETANAIVRLIHQSSATGVLEFAGGRIQLLGIRLERDSPILGEPLKKLWNKYGNLSARIVSIKRKEKTLIPGGNDILVAGDQIFVICEKNLVPTFVQITGKKDVSIQNIMILGGGLIGQFVAENLEDNINVKVIEVRSDKSEKIANMLKKTLVIHGDGTNIDLLATEGILDMDAFISVTGDDETNIICTLVAGHLKVPRTIALVNKTEYLPITPTIGMDAVVSKQLITVNAILRFIRRSTLESVSSIPGLDAEIIEIIPSKGSKITKQPLKSLHFRPSAILGAVTRNNEVIIPTGDTQVQTGDRVIIFSLTKAVPEVEKLFK
ncbi:MAG: Trk system potassium transporter TrkA [Candidatus Aminicenantes bacterium]|nr:MAG: Trk system potassium transporter TrkA [Candidatus Aminicenantes bacterium]